MVGKITDPRIPGSARIYFIYNANSGKLNAYLDMMHKIVSPKTYPCQLCDITYGITKIRPEWKNFREKSRLNMIFLHKDEWEIAFPLTSIALPSVVVENGNEFQTLLGPEDWERLTLDDLILKLEYLEQNLISS
ncbi:GTPase [Algoriphagus litoralis]|uniref:GTPase n=1 Tax=Algoriphagus litoralis TaxID=2202829 RepID=UPI000DB9B176|nr:GTPase [Algoriphagus litoralis]